jgi:hypothetical protein
MITQLRRGFSSATSGKFNIFSSFSHLKSFVSTPLRHLKRSIQPTGSSYSPQTNTTSDAFEEVAHEWQALIVGNPYDVNVFNYLEAVAQTNFGTVDNPHVVFTSDAPFRYVGCSGQPNEDDYEGHEFMLFMLREGPLQRCAGCGQVFKLVRLRDEYTPEMDYYTSGFLPYEVQEMSEFDTPILMNPLKLATHHEYTQFESPSNYIYSLVNNDDHDRILTDPAYRMEKTLKSEELFKIYAKSLQQLDDQYNETHGIMPIYPMNRVDYATLLDTEKAIMKIDRTLKKVTKFNSRKFIDPANHERRESRMSQKAKKRWDKSLSFYYGDLTEEEQKYRDYFETDLEKFPENEKQEEELDEKALLSRDDYKLKHFDFQEEYTNLPEDDQATFIERKVFQYKYRMANDETEVFERRNARMIENHKKRFSNPTFVKEFTEFRRRIVSNPHDFEAAEKYKTLLKEEAIAQFKDYFADSNEDFSFLEGMAGEEEAKFLTIFENHCVEKDISGFVTFPKREWNKSLGLWMNFYLDLKEAVVDLRPRMKKVIEEAEELGQTIQVISGEEPKVKEIKDK